MNDQTALHGVLAVRFTGQEYDLENDLYYYNARFYDPNLGVFTSADSIVPSEYYSQAFNRYMYVMGNPLIYNDPSGHLFWFVPVIIIAAVVGAIAGGTKGNVKGWVQGKQKFDWNGAAKGAFVGGLSAAAMFGGAAIGGALFGSATLAGAVGTGASAGFAGGFAGSALSAWMDGASLGDGLKAGLYGGIKGALIGGAVGAIGFGYDAYLNSQAELFLNDQSSGLGAAIRDKVESMSWDVAMAGGKYGFGAGFIKGTLQGLLEKRSIGESLMMGMSTGGQWGLAGFYVGYFGTSFLEYTAWGGLFGLATGFISHSLSATNPRLWLGAGIGMSMGFGLATQFTIPFFVYDKKR